MNDSDQNHRADDLEQRPTLAEELATTEPVEGAADTETTQQFDAVREPHEQDEPTQVFEAQSAATGDEHTRVMEPIPAPLVDPEAERREALERRREELAARDRALGNVNRAEAVEQSGEVAPYSFTKRSTDKFLGAFGLFVLRLVTAGILGVHGYQKVTDINATIGFFEQIGIPYANYAAWGVGIAELLAAIALVFGFMVRVVGLGVMAIAIGALAFVKWGAQSPFRAGESGFVGELELLLAAVGFTLFCLGGGGWGMDGGIRRSRARKKAGL